MRFNVAQLLKSSAGSSREYDLDDDISGVDKELDVDKPLVGKVRFLRTGNGVLATGHVHTQVRAPCRRCLKPVSVTLELDLEEEFRPSIDIVTGAMLPLADGEDQATRIDARHVLDLTEVVRQGLLLALPMSALCSTACRGLCPNCGADLNEDRCDCQQEEEDPRLAVLRGLL